MRESTDITHVIENELLAGIPRVKFSPGDPILFQGEISEKVGYVTSGRARAISYSEDGSETWIGYFSKGEFFGHVSALTDLPVHFEICADTDIEVAIMSASKLTALLESDPEISRVITQDLAQRLNSMILRLVEALSLTAKGRVCAELVRLSVPIGKSPDMHIIRPNPIFVEMALRVNSTRETVSRTVSELQKKGILAREPGAIRILNPAALKASVS